MSDVEGGGRDGRVATGMGVQIKSYLPFSCFFSRSDQLKQQSNKHLSAQLSKQVGVCTCLKCDATHSSVYGCDSVQVRVERPSSGSEWPVHVHSRLSVLVAACLVALLCISLCHEA